ncbi:hypothetical protein [Kutzneria sp. 744]|uniref:hypothetical protein n=1 Tax=Kutzneria sp. (strain 744) TaxID=345341 RepID=UPI0003EEDB43|nr:hypothetical protein [Kutzneria sp. 744]EWM18922.1 transposase [Kutzneria sp. 744]
MNWIEAEFAALRHFALGGTDHRSHAEQNAAIAAYVRWRNARAQPKTGFATDSPIRTWTHYPTKVAGQATSSVSLLSCGACDWEAVVRQVPFPAGQGLCHGLTDEAAGHVVGAGS